MANIKYPKHIEDLIVRLKKLGLSSAQAEEEALRQVEYKKGGYKTPPADSEEPEIIRPVPRSRSLVPIDESKGKSLVGPPIDVEWKPYTPPRTSWEEAKEQGLLPAGRSDKNVEQPKSGFPTSAKVAAGVAGAGGLAGLLATNKSKEEAKAFIKGEEEKPKQEEETPPGVAAAGGGGESGVDKDKEKLTPSEYDTLMGRIGATLNNINKIKYTPYTPTADDSAAKEYESEKAQARKEYESERDQLRFQEVAGMLGKALAQYGAAVEGAKIGMPVGTLDFGKGIDYGARARESYKDYIDELQELRDIRQKKERAKSDADKLKYEEQENQRKFELERQGKVLYGQLQQLETLGRAAEREDARGARQAEKGEGARLARETLTVNTIQKQIDDLDAIRRIPDKELKKQVDAYASKYKLKNQAKLWGEEYDPNELRDKLDAEIAALKQQQLAIAAGGGTTGVESSGASKGSSGKIRVRHKPTGAIKELTQDELNQLKSKPNANEFEQL